jgi:hypothetical protein
MQAHGTETPGLTTDRLADSASGPALRTPLLAWLAAVLACVLAYLAFAIPGDWFPSAAVKTWTPRELTVVRGTAQPADGAI